MGILKIDHIQLYKKAQHNSKFRNFINPLIKCAKAQINGKIQKHIRSLKPYRNQTFK